MQDRGSEFACCLRCAGAGAADQISRRQSGLVSGEAPTDMWRELCWWYVAYPARGEPGTALVFAVGVKQHRPAIRFALAGPDMPALPRQG
jgi:hypothetical protein